MNHEHRFTVPILEPIRLTGIAAELADDAAQRSGVLDETIRKFIDSEERIQTNPHLLHRMPGFQDIDGPDFYARLRLGYESHGAATDPEKGDVLESMTRVARFEQE